MDKCPDHVGFNHEMVNELRAEGKILYLPGFCTLRQSSMKMELTSSAQVSFETGNLPVLFLATFGPRVGGGRLKITMASRGGFPDF